VLETDDIFLGAFALVRGGELRSVRLRGVNGRRLAVFRIEGEAADVAESDYYRGDAVVNLQLLKFQVRRLKDRAFDAIREEERRDASQQGGYRADPRREPHPARSR
jgi:hypothetical protein